jgi:hypothetical protein
MPVYDAIKSQSKNVDGHISGNIDTYLPVAVLVVQLLSQAPSFVWLPQQQLPLPAF